MSCTGISAFWCPAHGDCTCERLPDGDCMFDGRDCPLHSGTSEHADTVERTEVDAKIAELAAHFDTDLSAEDKAELTRFGQLLYERSRKRKPEEPRNERD